MNIGYIFVKKGKMICILGLVSFKLIFVVRNLIIFSPKLSLQNPFDKLVSFISQCAEKIFDKISNFSTRLP